MGTNIRLLLLLLLLAPLLPAHAGRDDDAAAKAGVAAPAEWIFPPARPLRVWTIHGLWYERWGLDRAFARAGGAAVTESWFQPNWIRWYTPDSFDELQRHHLVIVADVNANAFASGRDPGVMRRMLKDYVAGGGSVLFLGGWFAYGGEYRGTAFEEIAPVTFGEGRDLVQVPGLPLVAGPDTLGKAFPVAWDESPRVYWLHAVTPRPGAKVLVTAGGKPLLVAGTYGKGRVAVFAGTLLGDPPAGALPFWAWNGWPTVLAQTVRWLAEPAGQPAPAADLRAPFAAALGKANGKADAEMAVFARFARKATDAGNTALLLAALADAAWDPSPELIETLARAAAAVPDPRYTEPAAALAHAGKLGRAQLGLRVLGAAHAPEAKALLLEALATGALPAGDDEELQPEAMGKSGDDGAHLIRLAALDGLAALGDPSALPALRKVIADNAKKLPKVADYPKDVPPAMELYQGALLAAVRCGDAAATGPLIDQLLINGYIRVNLMFGANEDGKGPAAELRRAAARRELTALQRRQERACTLLGALPPAVLLPLAQRLAAESEPTVAPLAAAVFASPANPRTPAITATLKTSPVPAVADLATAQ
jgi:uncharacterized membrane protein